MSEPTNHSQISGKACQDRRPRSAGATGQVLSRWVIATRTMQNLSGSNKRTLEGIEQGRGIAHPGTLILA